MTAARAALLVSLLRAAPAGAVEYMTIGEAVTRFIPKDAKVFKVTKHLTAAQKQLLLDDYGWKPDKDETVFYVGKRDGQPVAYVFVVPEIFNTCFHKYGVAMKPSGEVIETVIVELSCPRAFKINRKSFLSQFEKKRHVDPLTVHADIDAVTGATLSSVATATAARKAVSLHHLLFAGGGRVDVAQNVRQAREKAAGLIQRAIETGETLKKEGKGDGAAQLPPTQEP
jgi:hypothetical protein